MRHIERKSKRLIEVLRQDVVNELKRRSSKKGHEILYYLNSELRKRWKMKKGKKTK